MTIVSLLPADLKTFLTNIENLGFSLCLVGGAPRDYLMDRSYLSHDLDFELRHKSVLELKQFFSSHNIAFTELPYDIVRVPHGNFDLEFSTPRIEEAIADNKSHHHFNAILNPELSYSDSFKRRDFTLNTIGIEIDFKNSKEVVVDPFGGLADLQAKRLKQAGPDFFLDSVRFLRLIRFMIKYNFEMDQSLQERIGEFDLSLLSVHHFTEEMLKSKKPGIFINAFNNLVKVYSLKTPEKYEFLKNFHFTPDIETIDDLLVDSFLTNIESAQNIAKFFSLPEKRLNDLKSFHSSINHVALAKREEYELIAHTPIAELQDVSLLKDLKNLEDKKEWKIYSNDELPVGWNDWSDIKVETHEIESTPVALRSYLRFYKAVKKVFGNV